MRENKRKLKFKKIKIANMNSLRGGGETDTVTVYTDACPTNELGCSPYPGSDPANPCSDACFIVQTGAGAEPWLCFPGRPK